MKGPTAAILLALLAITYADAKRTRTGPTRVPKTPKTEISATVSDSLVQRTDTIHAPARDAVILSGFDKTVRAYKESFFVTNSLPDSLTITALELTLDYSDMSGRQIHRSEPTVRCYIPPGQTRQITIPAWDRQHTFYYYLSPAPKRVQATPFKVSSTVRAAVVMQPEVILEIEEP